MININKIKKASRIKTDGKKKMYITIKDKDGKILYDNVSYGGCFSSIKEDKIGEGNYQTLLS